MIGLGVRVGSNRVISNTQTIIEQISQYGTVVEAWEGGTGTFNDTQYSALNGYNSNDLLQASPTNQPYRRRINGEEVVWLNSNQRYLSIGSNPFASYTDCTVFVLFYPENQHILIGEDASSDRIWRSTTGTSSNDVGFGTPSFYLDGVAKSWVNAGAVFADVGVNDWRLMTAKGGSFATWVGFNLSWFNGTSLLAMLGFVKGIYIIEENLSDPDREAIEAILLGVKSTLVPQSYSENNIVVTSDVADTACTGLDYDASRDEIVMCHWGTGAAVNKLVFYDRATLTINAETPNLLPGVSGLQGVCYIPSFDAYLANNGTGNFYLIERDGTITQTYTPPVGTACTDSALDYYDGFIWFRDDSDGTLLRKCSIDASTITLEETITLSGINVAIDGGLHVDASGVIIWGSGPALTKYGWDNVIDEIITSTGADVASTEGITMDGDGVVYTCRDEYYHGGTPNGNKMWYYTPI